MTQVVCSDQDLLPKLGEFVSSCSSQAIQRSGKFTIALSGGSLPATLAKALLLPQFTSSVDWAKWHVFFVDERIVPLEDPDSNFGACQKVLFSKVPIPPEHIYKVATSLPPKECAAAYQESIVSVCGPDAVFDLVMLGMGPDGHTASLFPGHQLLSESNLLVASIEDSPKPPPQRITITLKVINGAGAVAFVATGSGKQDMLVKVLKEKDQSIPSCRVNPTSGKLFWFLNTDAAAKL